MKVKTIISAVGWRVGSARADGGIDYQDVMAFGLVDDSDNEGSWYEVVPMLDSGDGRANALDYNQLPENCFLIGPTETLDGIRVQADEARERMRRTDERLKIRSAGGTA